MMMAIEIRPTLAASSSLMLGRRGFTKSRVMSAEALLRVESMLLMMAAMRPAMTRPTTPTGRSWVTRVGNTWSPWGMSGKTRRAARPGRTMIKRTGSLSSPPRSAPSVHVIDAPCTQHALHDVLVCDPKVEAQNGDAYQGAQPGGWGPPGWLAGLTTEKSPESVARQGSPGEVDALVGEDRVGDEA